METFTAPKALVANPSFQSQRKKSLARLRDDMIDEPIIELINSFNNLPYCFTLQSCYGHFVYNRQTDPRNFEPLPLTDIAGRIEYRIAYIAFCIDYGDGGRKFLDALSRIVDIDPDYIQFCCAEWFWKRQVNTYALQVEPDRFKAQDTAIVHYEEALTLEKRRNEFFAQLKELLDNRQWEDKCG